MEDSDMTAEAARFTHDPAGFVLWAFPWGEGELAGQNGPRQWQGEILRAIGERLKSGATVQQAIQIAVASGHGIGKSALVSWLNLWAMSTAPNTRGVVTANTDSQLTTKTWAELAKWFRLCITSPWFTMTATALFSKDESAAKTWRIDAIPWNESRPESFAGLHNKGNRILVVFDEASAIPDIIWQTTEGALTDEGTEIIWAAFGNPTRNTGRFHEAFHRLRHRWHCRQIDSRKVNGTNKAQISKWVDDYGEDSDFVRVRVRGQFPRASSTQFIPSDLVDEAMSRASDAGIYDPLILGVDVARFGDDSSEIVPRRGLDAKKIPWRHFRGLDTMQLAAQVALAITELHPDAVFVDETGVGAGVIDRLRQLGYRNVYGVNNGAKPDGGLEQEACVNKGAECWARGRAWLKAGGSIPNDQELRDDLTGREYGFNAKNEIVLESKDDMKRRGLHSPDKADGLFLTFAQPVPPRREPGTIGQRQPQTSDFDPFRET
jgi:hypothetical protein